MKRRLMTRRMRIGNVEIGGGAPIPIQSMTDTRTSDIKATVAQINRLAEAGCSIVRVAVPDMQSARAIRRIKGMITIPVVADIHFDHRLALASMESGVDALRLNPGNIRDTGKISEVVRMASARRIPIRIGVNSGSVDRTRFDANSAAGLVDSAMGHIRLLEKAGFKDIKVSLKSTDVLTTIEAYRMMARKRRYPLHLGITEAGTLVSGAVKSAAGMGVLLHEGIGDTIRVSLTADPVQEILTARKILRCFGLYHGGVEVISCPTCGRTSIDVRKIAEEVERRTMSVRTPLKVAVMGCAVNGPGEARDADIGISGGIRTGILFRKGAVIRKVKSSGIITALMDEIAGMDSKP